MRISTLCILVAVLVLLVPVSSSPIPIGGIETMLTTGTPDSDQRSPAIWNDRVVWEDYRNWNGDIYLYNITSGTEMQVTDNSSEQIYPAISGKYIVWQDFRNMNSDIYTYDIESGNETRVTDDESDQGFPAISGSRIVWQDFRNGNADIYLFDLETGRETQVTDDPSEQTAPCVSGDRIVYTDTRNGNFEIYLSNITTGTETRLTNSTTDHFFTGISGDRVVWSEVREDILVLMLHNLTSGITIPVTPVPTGFPQQNPRINGDRVVWEDLRNDYGDIYLFDTISGDEYRITSDISDQIIPCADGDRIVWQDYRNGNWDIFLFTIGAEGSCPVAGFTHNATIGPAPFAVGFNDTSSGLVSHWTWDFGDGNRSHVRNPVHTYVANGTYSVSLTVDTPSCRDQVTETDLISVGSPPVPGFAANITEGPAPLTVSFLDTSAGVPDEWAWDFGDNTSSALQNPEHTYSFPGTFAVCLTAGNLFGNSSLVKPDFITVVRGVGSTISTGLPGLEILDGGQRLRCNETLVNLTLNGTGDNLLEIMPPAGSGLASVIFRSDEAGFRRTGNATVEGNTTRVQITSTDIRPGFSDLVGSGCSLNITQNLTSYPDNGTVSAVLWEGATPGDEHSIQDVVVQSGSGFAGVTDIAYSARFATDSFPGTGPAKITMGVSTEWVRLHSEQYSTRLEFDTNPSGAEVYVDGNFVGFTRLYIPLTAGVHTITFKRSRYDDYTITRNITLDSMRVIRIPENGSAEILTTRPVSPDPAGNLDYYEAYSPNGLSKFVLVSLYQTTNPFQLVVMTVTAAQSGNYGGGGSSSGGGSGGGGGYSGSGSSVAQSPAQVQAPSGTVQPPEPASGEPAQPVPAGTAQPQVREAETPAGGSIPEVAVVTPGSSVFVSLLQVVALVSVVSITIVAIYYSRRRGGFG